MKRTSTFTNSTMTTSSYLRQETSQGASSQYSISGTSSSPTYTSQFQTVSITLSSKELGNFVSLFSLGDPFLHYLTRC
jgi:hypothetical protein